MTLHIELHIELLCKLHAQTWNKMTNKSAVEIHKNLKLTQIANCELDWKMKIISPKDSGMVHG